MNSFVNLAGALFQEGESILAGEGMPVTDDDEMIGPSTVLLFIHLF